MDDCIIWTKALDSHGYGQSWRHGKPYKAHRAAYEEKYNIILEPPQFLLHKCDVPACVNSDHLYIGTQKENMRDRKLREGYKTLPRGEQRKDSKLKTKDVLYIRTCKISAKELALLFNVSQSLISKVRNNKKWKHVT